MKIFLNTSAAYYKMGSFTKEKKREAKYLKEKGKGFLVIKKVFRKTYELNERHKNVKVISNINILKYYQAKTLLKVWLERKRINTAKKSKGK